jgi:hypothetical protein
LNSQSYIGRVQQPFQTRIIFANQQSIPGSVSSESHVLQNPDEIMLEGYARELNLRQDVSTVNNFFGRYERQSKWLVPTSDNGISKVTSFCAVATARMLSQARSRKRLASLKRASRPRNLHLLQARRAKCSYVGNWSRGILSTLAEKL